VFGMQCHQGILPDLRYVHFRSFLKALWKFDGGGQNSQTFLHPQVSFVGIFFTSSLSFGSLVLFHTIWAYSIKVDLPL
jgi:hypothetical protein